MLLHGAGQTGDQWTDIGLVDVLDRIDVTLATARSLRSSGMDLTEHIWDGVHENDYWQAHLAEYLAFHLGA